MKAGLNCHTSDGVPSNGVRLKTPYVSGAPSPQQTLDIFSGKWASKLPGVLANLTAGNNPHFEDPRIGWTREAFRKLGISIAGSSILELGPLEGGHTYMLAKEGAASVTAIEAHEGAYLKCLIVKELLGIERVNFLLGDAVSFLRQIEHFYDIGFASGFLYHMANPVELIELLCRRSRAIYLWTVYWEEEFARKNPEVPAGSGHVTKRNYHGFEHVLHQHSYGFGVDYGKFWGGPADHSNWMEKTDILRAFAHFGFKRQICADELNPNGAALSMVAVRDSASRFPIQLRMVFSRKGPKLPSQWLVASTSILIKSIVPCVTQQFVATTQIQLLHYGKTMCLRRSYCNCESTRNLCV